MRSIVGLVLIIGGIALGYFGYTKYQDSKGGVKIGNVEITASDSKDQTSSYLMMGGGVVALIAGAIMLSKRGK